MSGPTIIGPAKRCVSTPSDRTFAGLRAPKVPKKLRKNVEWLLRNEYAVIAGRCSLYRPNAIPAGFELKLDSKTFTELWVCPAGAEDEETHQPARSMVSVRRELLTLPRLRLTTLGVAAQRHLQKLGANIIE